MHVKRLYRPTVREALAAAREELGPSALVLSTELVPAPGWRGWVGQRMVRLTAAAERAMSESRTPVADVRQPDTDVPAASRPEPTRVERAERPRRPGIRSGVVARLMAIGVDSALATAIANRMTDAECRGVSEPALRRAFAAELEPMSGADAQFSRYEVFVGPPGVGKTTTIAKIAAQERAMRGRTLGLVAADAFRAGAVEQLCAFAAIVGSPLRVARSASELGDALDASRHTALVDTAGRSAADRHLTDLFDVLAKKKGVRTHLVVAADTSASAANRIFDRYASAHPARVVITKVDETESLMPLLSVVRERGLPVSYVTTGQRVPEDLWRATPASLAAACLREAGMEGQTCH